MRKSGGFRRRVITSAAEMGIQFGSKKTPHAHFFSRGKGKGFWGLWKTGGGEGFGSGLRGGGGGFSFLTLFRFCNFNRLFILIYGVQAYSDRPNNKIRRPMPFFFWRTFLFLFTPTSLGQPITFWRYCKLKNGTFQEFFLDNLKYKI